MKAAMICAAVLVAGLMFTTESRAQNYFGGGFGPGQYYGFGYSRSWYVPVPPYYALHPPVYYSHEIVRRPIGDSPYAYQSGRPAAAPIRQFSRNPFLPDPVREDGSKQTSEATDSVATVMKNPFYSGDLSSLVGSKLIYNPYYVKPEAAIADASER